MTTAKDKQALLKVIGETEKVCESASYSQILRYNLSQIYLIHPFEGIQFRG